MRIWIYGIIKRLKVFNGLLSSLERRIAINYPEDRKELIKKTISSFLGIGFIYILIGILLILGRVKLYLAVISMWLIYHGTIGYIKKRFFKEETRLLMELEKFLSELRYRYQLIPIIEDALREAADNSSRTMMLHGYELIKYLGEGSDVRGDAYEEHGPNGFFLTLFSLCNTVRIYGGKEQENTFLENLGFLKEDIHTEILKRQKCNSVFSGLTILSLVPIGFIIPIEKWAVYNMPELDAYFKSVTGKLTTAILALISVLVYMVILELKYQEDGRYEPKSRILKLLNIKIIDKLIVGWMSINYNKALKLNNRLQDMAYKYNVREFVFMRIVKSISFTIFSCLTMALIGLPAWIGIPMGIVFYVGLYISLLVKEIIIKLGREEEIMRFQNIILIMINSNPVNVHMILERMEIFAVVFRRNIEYLIDEYPSKGMDAFREVSESCNYRPFERIMEGFIACDSVGVAKAFSELKADRRYYIEKHKQDNEILLNNKGAIAKLIAFLPLYGVIIFKLIVPYVVEGLKMMSRGF